MTDTWRPIADAPTDSTKIEIRSRLNPRGFILGFWDGSKWTGPAGWIENVKEWRPVSE